MAEDEKRVELSYVARFYMRRALAAFQLAPHLWHTCGVYAFDGVGPSYCVLGAMYALKTRTRPHDTDQAIRAFARERSDHYAALDQCVAVNDDCEDVGELVGALASRCGLEVRP